MDSVSTESFANCSCERLDGFIRGTSVKMKFGCRRRGSTLTFEAPRKTHVRHLALSPPAHFQSISTPSSFAFIDLKIDSRCSGAVCAKQLRGSSVLGWEAGKLEPQPGRGGRERDKVMRSVGPRHPQQPSNGRERPRTASDCQKPAPSVRLVPVMKLSVSAGLL